jgi:hypothetical protein
MAAQDLVTLAQVREFLEYQASNTTRDALISSLITHASDELMEMTSREFAPATASATRRFRIEAGRQTREGVLVNLAPYDLRAATLVRLHPEATVPTTLTAGTDYELQPQNPRSSVYTEVVLSRFLSLASDTSLVFGHANLDITGSWGFASVPSSVQQACIEIVGATVERRIPAMSDAELVGIPTMPSGSLIIPASAKRKLRRWQRQAAY